MSKTTPEPAALTPASPARAPIERVTAASDQEGNGFDLWQEVCRPILDVVSCGPLRKFETAFEFYDADGLVFNRVNYSATHFKRTSRHLRGGAGDLILVHMLLSGSEQGLVDGRPFRMDPTRIIIQDWAHRYETVTEDTEQISVAIPRDRLASSDLLYEKFPVIDLANDSPKGMMLGNALRSACAALPRSTQAEAPAIAAGFLGMLDGLLNPSAGSAVGSVPGKTSLSAMQDFLNRRLHDPSVGIDTLTRAFQCSRSTIYRLFHECGGVRGYLGDQRLNQAFRILTSSAPAKGSIVKLAASLGFRDAGYFHRSFKRRFGLTAGEVREVGSSRSPEKSESHSADNARPELSKLHRWFGTAD